MHFNSSFHASSVRRSPSLKYHGYNISMIPCSSQQHSVAHYSQSASAEDIESGPDLSMSGKWSCPKWAFAHYIKSDYKSSISSIYTMCMQSIYKENIIKYWTTSNCLSLCKFCFFLRKFLTHFLWLIIIAILIAFIFVMYCTIFSILLSSMFQNIWWSTWINISSKEIESSKGNWIQNGTWSYV